MSEQNSNKKNFIFGLVSGIAIISIIGFVILLVSGSGGDQGNKDESTVANTVKSSQSQGVAANSLQEILKEITPTGTPDYGEKAGVSYDKVEQSLSVITSFDKSIKLNEKQEQRYLEIGSTPLTACEFCCGIKENGFLGDNGSPACGCSHNIAASGLTKWLIQNSSYTNDEIVAEIGKWKILYFPKGAVEKEVRKRGVTPGGSELPSMRGGC